MRTTILLVGLIATGVTGDDSPPVPSGKTSAPDAKPSDLTPVIEQLADPAFRTRAAAARKLEAEGLRSIPQLRKALNHPDPEIRKRVSALVPYLETAAILTPRRVTLKVANKPLKEILDDFQKQTGYKIECPNYGRAVYSFDFSDVPFWEALDRVCQAAGIVIPQGYGDTVVRLQHASAYAPYVCHQGAFRLLPTGFQQQRSVEFGLVGKPAAQGTSHETISYQFTVFAEPKLPLLGVSQAKVDAAYDTEGNSLLPGTDPGEVAENGAVMWRGGRFVSHYGGGNRAISIQTSLELRRRSSTSSTLKVVRGSVPVTLLADQRPVVVADKVLAAKGRKVKVGSTQIQIEEAKETAKKQYTVRLSLIEDNADPNDYSLANSIYQRLELQDAKGNKYGFYGSSVSINGPGHVQMTLNFFQQGGILGNVGPAEKLVFQAWTTLPYQLPFEFRNLPLP